MNRHQCRAPTRLLLVAVSGCARGKTVSCFGIDIVVPSPEHLIALKLHALAHGPEDRYEKDFSDIVGIARLTHLDPHSAVLKEIFDRYGNEEIYSKFIHRVESR